MKKQIQKKKIVKIDQSIFIIHYFDKKNDLKIMN